MAARFSKDLQDIIKAASGGANINAAMYIAHDVELPLKKLKVTQGDYNARSGNSNDNVTGNGNANNMLSSLDMYQPKFG